jgi:steroid delta-isomerase-like uncharacterized protein
MSEADNIRRVHERVALLNKRDFAAYAAPLGPAFVGESAAVPEGIRGPESVQQQLFKMLMAFPDMHLDVENVIAKDNHVVSCIKITGTHKGTYAGIPATNKTVTWGVCTVTELDEEGKTVRSRLYGDSGSLLRQIGGLPSGD